ncbi:alpha/beta hydrolase [Streptomyces sp. NBC_00440]|uniref:alpha/beta fold hydrolase n=1 Tax=unclassified Streptomyces TaxID=2593676 RepID=UPI002E1F6995|nr:alpha/beta hydrolase [Streptomyces sp. NBC_00932]
MTSAVGSRLHPVVLLHALPLNSAMWRSQAAALRARGHLVLTPDQRGFGTTPLGSGPPSLDIVADDLAALLDERDIDGVALAGCSMGGYVAMAFLRRHPGRVRALALLASRATADTHETAAERLRFADLMLDETLHGQVVRRTAPLLLGASTRAQCPDLVEEVLAMAEDAPPETVAWAQRAIAARPDSLSVLRATGVPAVVVTGAEDELVSLQDAARTADALPRGRLVVVPGTGHLQPMEASAQVTSLLTTLLDDAMTADRNR